MIVQYIDEHRERFGAEPICRVLRAAGVQIAPSSYYAVKTRPPSVPAVADAALTRVIAEVHETNCGVDGARKMHAELRRSATLRAVRSRFD